MTDPREYGAGPGAHSGPLGCADVEAWLAESAENALPPAIAEPVRVHASGCAACKEKLAQARSGREWLLVLKQESLEPPADLVAKILARTNLADVDADWKHPVPHSTGKNRTAGNGVFGGSAAVGTMVPLDTDDTSIPAWQHSSVVVLRRTLLDPRLALVAAMAFFSISLTLNMLGFRFTSLHAADLTPRNMHRAITRQVAEANASVVRYYENLRIVYEMEARVQQLRRAAQTSTPPQQVRPRKQSSDSTGDSNGNSSTRPLNSHRDGLAARPDPKPIATSPRMDAALNAPGLRSSLGDWLQIAVGHTLATTFVPLFAFQCAPQVSSCTLDNICSSMRYFSTRERRLA